MASSYTPTTFYKGADLVIAESWEEHWQLLWDGYRLGGPPAEVPRTGQHVSFGELAFELAPLLEQIATLTELVGEGSGGGVNSILFDEDGVPYLTDLAGTEGSDVSFDTDGVPYLLIGA